MEIGELASVTGVTRRTIRYYVAIGLLPPGEEQGSRRIYSQRHIGRLQLIRKLKDQFLPLDEIKKRMSGLTDEDIALMFSKTVAQRVTEPRMLYDLSLRYCEKSPTPPEQTGPSSHHQRKNRELRSSNWRREELAPGVELHVKEDASPSISFLVEKIRKLARSHTDAAYREPETDSSRDRTD